MTGRMTPILLMAAALSLPISTVALGGEPPCDSDADACIKYMIQSFDKKGWIGIELDYSAGGSPRITRVLSGSPAEAAGLSQNDVLVALDGVAYATATEDQLREAKQSMVPGREVELTIERGGEELLLPVTLGQIPQSVLAQWIGNHLIEAHGHQYAKAPTD